jgi:pyruvate, orthophosphate dikinase
MSDSTGAVDVPGILALDGGTGADRDLLGGKAWSIEKMRSLGIPVPPAFVLTTEVCRRFHAEGDSVPADVLDGLPAAMAALEAETGRTFGGGDRPLLVSVRSGAAISMPGMMDTVLNLGMTDEVEAALATVDAGYAADTRRRFVAQFTHVVGEDAPEGPWEQLHAAIAAVFRSWQNPRAVRFPGDGGTAVTVQAMVFGNLDDTSGTGVLFTRDPITGNPVPHADWLPRGQGEDVVSGKSDALTLAEMEADLPEAHADLITAATTLEREGRDVQDIEFTVESGKLWLLQARAAKTSPDAAVRLATVLVAEGLISRSEALDRLTPEQVEAVLKPRVDPAAAAGATVLARGKAACQGVGVGVVVTDADEAEDRTDDGEDVVLARTTTDPNDVGGMSAAKAVITEVGALNSHAALVCREMGVPCVVGCGQGTVTTLAGRTVTVDGAAGTVYEGSLPVVEPTSADDDDLARLTAWAREDAGTTEGALPALLRARRAAR